MRTVPATLLIAMFFCCACGSQSASPEPRLCNGSEDLCSRPFDQVAFATSHNGMSNEDEGWTAPNHLYGLEQQLADGVRAAMLDVYFWDDQVMLCHGFCAVQGVSIGQRSLVDALQAIGQFLRENPHEVFTIIFESYVSEGDMVQAFEDASVMDLLYSHDSLVGFPTLGQMIDDNTRLVVLSDEGSGVPAWLHYVWSMAFETDWDVDSLDAFSCAKRRGELDNELFILNHFVTAPMADREISTLVNSYDFLLPRAQECAVTLGHIPNFVTVDFYSLGDLMAVVDEINGA